MMASNAAPVFAQAIDGPDFGDWDPRYNWSWVCSSGPGHRSPFFPNDPEGIEKASDYREENQEDFDTPTDCELVAPWF
jgi:hypothetical protein